MGGATLTGTAASPGAAAQTQAPAAGQKIPAGSGVVRGQIVDAQSGRPIAGAGYEITGPEDSASGTTDDNGRFETRPIQWRFHGGVCPGDPRARRYEVWAVTRCADIRMFRLTADLVPASTSAGCVLLCQMPASRLRVRHACRVLIVLEPAKGFTH